MVVDDPGDWFEDTLASVEAQRYSNASLLVIDVGTDLDGARSDRRGGARRAGARPRGQPRLRAACNEALRAVQGAAFFLFCHDDVRLDPDAIQVMVEEAFRSNAGIVGPKLVEWNDPDRLLSVGMGADKTGYPAPNVERGELDQEQHDRRARHVLRAGRGHAGAGRPVRRPSGASTPASTSSARTSICVGGRKSPAPGWSSRPTRVSPTSRRSGPGDRSTTAAGCRCATACAPCRVVLDVVDASPARPAGGRAGAARDRLRRRARAGSARPATSPARGRGTPVTGARSAASARRWPRSGPSPTMTSAGCRCGGARDFGVPARPDRLERGPTAGSVHRTAVTGHRHAAVVQGAPLVAGRLGAGDRAASRGQPRADHRSHRRDRRHRRVLVAQRRPSCCATWLRGYRDVGLGSVSPTPTVLGLIGGLGYLFLDALGILRKVLVLGMLPLGVVGHVAPGQADRLAAGAHRRPRRLRSPCRSAFNAIAQGRWNGLVMYGVVPWILGQLLKGSGVAPFGVDRGRRRSRRAQRPLFQRIVAVGVLTALAAMVVAFALVLVHARVALALVVGGLLVGDGARRRRGCSCVGFGGAVVAFVLQLPWSVSFLHEDWAGVVSTSSAAAARSGWVPSSASRPARSVSGRSAGCSWRSPRWRSSSAAAGASAGRRGAGRSCWPASRWCSSAPGMAARSTPGDRGAPGARRRRASRLASAMGMAAFEVDLPDYHFGWRQIVSVLRRRGARARGAAGHRRDDRRPVGHAARRLRPRPVVHRQGRRRVPFRVLWMGDADVLPLASWPLDAQAYGEPPEGTFGYATSDNGMPSLDDRWHRRMREPRRTSARCYRCRRRRHQPTRALLAPMGVRYIAVPLGPAPEP